VNIRPAHLYAFSPNDYFAAHTFHIDVRYERAFRQTWEIAEAVTRAVSHGRRVVVEHFDLLHEALGYNAQVLFGIGEEVIVARPGVFGPFPGPIKDVVERTIKYRLMAHSAEDITSYVLERDYDYRIPVHHSDVKHGFVISFQQEPRINLEQLEAKVREIIAADVPISPAGEDRISIGGHEIPCTGTRTHVKHSGEIQDFQLLKEFRYHPLIREYMLVGIVGRHEPAGFEEITRVPGL
jgi:hypothetical protein